MRILITGVTGQVGSALQHSLRPRGTLQLCDRTALDLSRPAEIEQRLDHLRPDVIVNSAAYTAVDRAEDERDLAFTVNGKSPGIMARWAAAHQAALIHISTDYVFDGSGSSPWREDDPTGPLNVYGASKLAGERAVEREGGSYLIVRTSWVYAAIGVNFLRTMARLAAERDTLSVVSDQIGAPTSAAFIADTIAHLLDSRDFNRAGPRLHVAAGGHTSWHGFAVAIVDGLRRRGATVKTRTVTAIESKDYPTKAARPRNSRLDLSRLSSAFGVTPKPWAALLDRELDRLAPPPLPGG